MELIGAKNLILTYPGSEKPSLKSVDISIHKGDIYVLLGKSGSGKSTLMKCLASLLTHYQGDLTLEGRPLKSIPGKLRAKKIGFVSQSYDLFPHRTVLENCTDPRRIVLKTPPAEAKEKAMNLLDRFDLSDLASRYPSELSGGQKQRVAICRALCLNPDLILMDEPNSALDPQTTESFINLIRDLKARDQITFVITTHDLMFGKKIYDRGFYMENGVITHTFTSDETGPGNPLSTL